MDRPSRNDRAHGRLRACGGSRKAHAPDREARLRGAKLRFIDPRMFGKLSVHAGEFDPGGVEPLEASEEQFVALFRGRKTPIKSALLNQKLLRGVGNIYADESLFRAGIRPRRRAASITREQPGQAAPSGAGGTARGDRAGWIFDFRLRGRRWRRRVLPAPAPSLWPRGGAVSGVQDHDPAHCPGRTQQSLLFKLSKIDIIERFKFGTDYRVIRHE